MKTFLIVLVLGALLSVIFCFSPFIHPKFRIKLDRFLDKDIIHLKNGRIVKGWLFKETGGELFIEVKDGYFTISRSECEKIKENYLLQDVRKLI